jgi:hypothetical protein
VGEDVVGVNDISSFAFSPKLAREFLGEELGECRDAVCFAISTTRLFSPRFRVAIIRREISFAFDSTVSE